MTPPSPSLFLLDPFVGTYLPGGETADNKRTLLSSGAKKAFGFPADLDCDALMRGLALEADLAPAPDLSRLTLRGVRPFSTSVHAVDKNLIIKITSFPQVYSPDICLIYNAIARSLLMTPFAPRAPPSVLTPFVLVARPRVDDNISYDLVFPGTVDGTGSPGRRKCSSGNTSQIPEFPENGECHRVPNDDVKADRGGGGPDEADVGRRLKFEKSPHLDFPRAMKCQV
ncbi:hypothetical protein D1007_29432 [Hordeum vulgare]|nr:hypothetical protein D1007_29432 [Hordeum vulgare]